MVTTVLPMSPQAMQDVISFSTSRKGAPWSARRARNVSGVRILCRARRRLDALGFAARERVARLAEGDVAHAGVVEDFVSGRAIVE